MLNYKMLFIIEYSVIYNIYNMVDNISNINIYYKYIIDHV